MGYFQEGKEGKITQSNWTHDPLWKDPEDCYRDKKTGKVVSRITSDTQEFGDVLLFTSDVISQLISVFVLLFVLLSLSQLLERQHQCSSQRQLANTNKHTKNRLEG